MTDEKKTLTSKDFGLNLTELPKEKQGQLEKSLSILVQAARESIQKSKKRG
ncbi:hypothetical protein LMG8526HA_02448 [Lactococcus lactis]|uniref:Uncharacterized protein n=1 Tax=Lactococcus lactis subsp. lactis TaxID=1360 RepID=A0A0V8D801_LACLL|nr:hypothetical protein [Lactococcus lactis]KSU09739.1 hypothetical protein LMG8526_2362 [Lactococcus lactis subsp. lactis]KSU17653.1 hypothetical protein M20_2594 [Lactococcus lactis subsp. lactis]MDU0401549.1 hypothetical protein [Lactococcus lactis]